MEFIKNIQYLRKHSVEVTPIDKGYSFDKKYVISLESGEKVLLKTADTKDFESKLVEFKMLEKLNELQVKISKPIEIGKIEDLNVCYMLLSYIEGEDARDVLSNYSEDEQYKIGLIAGQELHKMHQIPAADTTESWEKYIIPKYKRYVNAYRDCGIKIKQDEKVIKFLEENERYLINRPKVFLHDDFHVGNIIVKDGRYAGAIDINRFDWGDPIHEFYKVALFSREVSIPFSIGQIRGYFEGGIPEEFWRLYAIYVAMSIFSSIVWTKQVTPHLIDEMLNRLDMIMEDHQNFELMKPVWFK